MTKIPICMPVYNRPDFLLQALTALKKCHGLDDFMIVVSQEPDCPETTKLLNQILPQMGVTCMTTTNPKKLGCAKNVERSLELGFATGADIVVSVEDDVVLAKDALLWFKWASKVYRDEPRIMAAAAWSKQEENYKPVANDLHEVWLASQFIPWGYVINKDRFAECRFVYDEADKNHWAWDMTMTMYMPGNCCMVVHPKVSRAQNIGFVGTGVSDRQFWLDNHYVHNFISDVWPDYPLVDFKPVRDDERKNNDRACLLGKPEGLIPLITRSVQ